MVARWVAAAALIVCGATLCRAEAVVPCAKARRATEYSDILDGAASRLSGGAPCYGINTGWWTYELCPGRWVRQFHVERDAVADDILLGVGPAALRPHPLLQRQVRYFPGGDTALDAEARPFGETVRRAIHPALEPSAAPGFQCARVVPSGPVPAPGEAPVLGAPVEMPAAHYKQGTFCGAESRPREATVVLTCEREDHFLLSFNVTEPEPCRYTVFVFGSAVCAAVRGDASFDAATAVIPAVQQLGIGPHVDPALVQQAVTEKLGQHPLPHQAQPPAAEPAAQPARHSKPGKQAQPLGGAHKAGDAPTGEQVRRRQGERLQSLYSSAQKAQPRPAADNTPEAPEGAAPPDPPTASEAPANGGATAADDDDVPEDSLIFSL